MVGTPCGDVDGGEEIDHGNRACDLQVGIGRPAARGIGARCQGERGVSAGGRAGASIGPHLADRGFCPPYAVRSMLTTHPPCAGAWREPRARECAAPVRATGAHVGLAQAASWGQAVAASRAGRQAVSKRRCRIGHAGRPISYLRARRHPKPSRLWQNSSQPPAYRSTREGGDVRRSSKGHLEKQPTSRPRRLTRIGALVLV